MARRAARGWTAGEAGSAPPWTRSKQPLGRELAQVAADGVLAGAELGGEVGGHEAAVAGQAVEEGAAALAGQHGHPFDVARDMHERACMIVQFVY